MKSISQEDKNEEFHFAEYRKLKIILTKWRFSPNVRNYIILIQNIKYYVGMRIETFCCSFK
tara:strand:- start:55 stop:237 length:183 start_codon:yes stop_codon:yes gene_type:complete